MLPTETRKALKEWSVVLKALGEGHQILLFRKGGIIERNRQFEVESPSFFLYPTYVHQTSEQLQPPYQPWIAQTEAERPDTTHVCIQYFATVEKVLAAKGIDRLRHLTDCFIWTPETVEKTYSWKPDRPAYLLFLRVYRLEQPLIVEEKPEYSGCKSWIDLDQAYPLGNVEPVISNALFQSQYKAIEAQLAESIVSV